MSLPTNNDVQAVEPILTNLLVGYSQADSRFVASKVFPGVPVDKDSGTYYIFTKKYWFRNEVAVRAPGGPYPQADFGVETGTYKTLQYALAKTIADEDRANSQIPMDLETAAVRWLAQQFLLNKEIQFAADFMKTGVWGTSTSGTTSGAACKWSDYSGSDPVADVESAKETVSNNTGMVPNSMVFGSIVRRRLVNHPDLLDRMKYTTVATAQSVDAALAAIFDVANVWIARATYSNTNEAVDFSASAIIDDDCLIAYVNPNPGLFEASAGYTFHWAPGGGLGGVLPIFRDGKQDADLIKSKEQWDQSVVASDLGYIYLDITD